MATLEQRPYGDTGEQVTAIGLGGAFIAQQSYADGVATVRRALELGVTYFDTSPFYCEGMSQAVMGEGLDGWTGPHLLATKLGYLDHPAKFRSPDALRLQLAENLRLLRRQRVDTLQVHESNLPQWWTANPRRGADGRFDYGSGLNDAPVMRVLREAKERGLCRFIGITGNSAADMVRILRQVEVDTCLLAFNTDLVSRDGYREAVPLAAQRKLALILGGVFHCGRLVAPRPEALEDESLAPEMRERFKRLYAIQRECGLALVELTIRFLLADRCQATIMVGASSPAQIEESVAAAERGPLPPDLHNRIEQLAEPES